VRTFFYQLLPPTGDDMGSTPIRYPNNVLQVRTFFISCCPQQGMIGRKLY
jgi:hypothetical protein